MTAANAITWTTSAPGELWSVANTVPISAIVNAAAAKPSMRMRFAATDGSLRPALQRRMVTTTESSAQCTKNPTTYTVYDADFGSSGPGKLGSANVQIVRPTVSAATAIWSPRTGGANAVANR